MWNSFTWLFLLLLGLSLFLEYWLASRHIGYVRAHRNSVPGAFRGKITLKSHRKSADYTIAKTQFGRTANLYGAALLLFWTIGGGLDAFDGFWRAAQWPPLVTGTIFIVTVFLAMEVLELPIVIHQTFEIEERFGFNRTTPALFAMDFVKKALLMSLIGAPLVLAALWLMQRYGERWWLYVWVLWMSFSLFMVWAYPALIAPLFNRFRPLKARGLRARLLKLLKRTGFKSHGIYVVDSSQRTSHGNAYFTGFGRAKRIVFFDSLLKTLRAPEVEAVVAHELGHFKLRHIAKRLLVMAATSFAGLAVLGLVIGQPWFYQGLGVTLASDHAALMLFLLAGPVFTFYLQPLYAWGSRRHEFQADDFAARQTSARNLVSALVKLYRENAATLTPDPLYSSFYDTHPPALRRIRHLLGK
jgi:STE24 endopeptidase